MTVDDSTMWTMLMTFAMCSGFTTVSVDGFQLPICHAMEVVDVVADYFHDKLSNGEIDVVSFVSQMICEKYPHLKCSRDIPSPFRDDGMPSYTVNSELVYIREGYAAVDIADCVSSVKGYPFSSFVTLIKMFNSVFEIQLQYLTRMQRCGFSPSVILDCGASCGSLVDRNAKKTVSGGKIFAGKIFSLLFTAVCPQFIALNF